MPGAGGRVGFGRYQLQVELLVLLTAAPLPLTVAALAGEVWGPAPSRSQAGSVRRALARLETAGVAVRVRDETFPRRAQLWAAARMAPPGYTRVTSPAAPGGTLQDVQEAPQGYGWV